MADQSVSPVRPQLAMSENAGEQETDSGSGRKRQRSITGKWLSYQREKFFCYHGSLHLLQTLFNITLFFSLPTSPLSYTPLRIENITASTCVSVSLSPQLQLPINFSPLHNMMLTMNLTLPYLHLPDAGLGRHVTHPALASLFSLLPLLLPSPRHILRVSCSVLTHLHLVVVLQPRQEVHPAGSGLTLVVMHTDLGK